MTRNITDCYRQKTLYCFRCTAIWKIPDKPVSSPHDEPEPCPECNRTDWNDPDLKLSVCRHCGHTWDCDMQDEPCPVCNIPRNLVDESNLRRYRCGICDYTWIRKKEGLPNKCPVCRNPSWYRGRARDHRCMQCGHKWRNCVESPKRCPSCFSERWDQTVYRYQCRRCGHRWRSYQGSSENISLCPSCKSRKWNETPQMDTCLSCGCIFSLGTTSKVRVCPECRGRNVAVRRTCTFCGVTWSSSKNVRVCPNCGTGAEDESSVNVKLWSRGDRKLVYANQEGSGTIYLFSGLRPLASRYLSDVLDIFGYTLTQFMNAINDHMLDEKLHILSAIMEQRMEEYRDNIPYFMHILDLDETDAQILALHFTSMGPEAISLHLDIPLKRVRESFDRIMDAYATKGIVVDDTIYTKDPFEEYKEQLGIR